MYPKYLLCCPELVPQMAGGLGFEPVTWKMSVKQREAVLCPFPPEAIGAPFESENSSVDVEVDGPVRTKVSKSSLNCN